MNRPRIKNKLHTCTSSINWQVYDESSPLLQLIKLINDLKNDDSDTILQQVEMRNYSYRTFSYNVSMACI